MKKQKGFTLIELTIVGTIVFIMVALVKDFVRNPVPLSDVQQQQVTAK
jgi:type II secretory pathway pseudopilin PulG